MPEYPSTGSNINRSISTSLSTQIIIKVGGGEAVGAIQSMRVTQARPAKRLVELGTDGTIELVPNQVTTFELAVERLVFDFMRLPESFGRGFHNINSQRFPFNIEVHDRNVVGDFQAATSVDQDSGADKSVVHEYINCWLTNYVTPYQTTDYTVIETATIMAETCKTYTAGGAVSAIGMGRFDNVAGQIASDSIESSTDIGERRGSLDAIGLVSLDLSPNT